MLFMMEAMESMCASSERAKTPSNALTAVILETWSEDLKLTTFAAFAENTVRVARRAIILTDIIAI